jgi:hypothetical protein
MGVIQYARFIPLLASGVVDPYPGYLVYDTFTDANGTALTAHTPDKRPGLNAWQSLQGTWEIQSNRAKLTATAGDQQNVAVIDAGDADATVEADLITGAGTNAGLIANCVDNDNYWVYIVASDGSCFLYERTGGGFNLRDNDTFVYSSGNTYALKIVTNGDAIDCYIDNVLKLSYSASGRAHKTATKHGLRTFGTDATSAFDNFSVAA